MNCLVKIFILHKFASLTQIPWANAGKGGWGVLRSPALEFALVIERKFLPLSLTKVFLFP